MNTNKKSAALIISTVLAVLAVFPAFADRRHNRGPVDPSVLPPAASQLLEQYFPGIAVMDIEFDHNEIEIDLADGTEINLFTSGEWSEIKSYKGVPAELIPPAVAKTVADQYPDVAVYKIEKEWNSYEVKLVNGMELVIGEDGTLYRQKYDR